MGSLFKKPKAPPRVVIPPVVKAEPIPEPTKVEEKKPVMPDVDDEAVKAEQRKKAARRISVSGRQSTILTGSDGLGGR